MASITHNIGNLEIKYDMELESLSIVSDRAGQWIINITNKPTEFNADVKEDNFKHTNVKLDLPDLKSVVNFITSKPNFEHDNAEIQEHFLGRILESRGEDKRLYFVFANLIRKAKDAIESEFEGEWESTETRELGKKRHVKVFTFKKEDTNQSRFNYLQ